jgi:PAS domain S-box-containing protein
VSDPAVTTSEALSAAELRALLNTVGLAAGDGLVAINERSIIQFANEALHEMWGYTPGELIHRPLQILMPRHYRPEHTNGVRRFIEEGKHDTSGNWNDVEALHKDGFEFPVWIRIRKVQHEGRFMLAASIRDARPYNSIHTAALQALALAEQGGDPTLINALRALADQVDTLNPGEEHTMHVSPPDDSAS